MACPNDATERREAGSRGRVRRFGSSIWGETVSLKEQLKSELIVLRRGESAIRQVVEPNEEPAGMGTQGSAEDGAS
jgi:hypothetical protein